MKKYDENTIGYDSIEQEDNYEKISPKMRESLSKLKADGRHAINGIIKLLNDNSLDHKAILGEPKYRYMIRCSQNKLAKLIGVDRGNFAKGIKQLMDANMIIKDNGVMYINPLIFNSCDVVDKRTLDKFGIKYNK